MFFVFKYTTGEIPYSYKGEIYLPQCFIPSVELANKFICELKDATAEENSAVSFECETAHPASKVTWLKGTKEIKAGGRYELTQKGTVLILNMKDLEKSDSEVYTCDIGSTKSTAKLTVKGKNLGVYCNILAQLENNALKAENLIFLDGQIPDAYSLDCFYQFFIK